MISLLNAQFDNRFDLLDAVQQRAKESGFAQYKNTHQVTDDERLKGKWTVKISPPEGHNEQHIQEFQFKVQQRCDALADNQQREDLLAKLKALLDNYKPLDTERMQEPSHVIVKGRPSNLTGKRLLSWLERGKQKKTSVKRAEPSKHADIDKSNSIKGIKR
ncbi:hypothetical protein EC973_002061 [Apophysomyces ossiformis]|uniref:Uncharacterized protein n=1 Tax=Apophysomyces ossiformis TaxID=679940 RepID=A0A8H7BSW0_9FUNG|nr:hypothetical protein EC973_002061 [Apophysomyces ossiformis]